MINEYIIQFFYNKIEILKDLNMMLLENEIRKGYNVY
jgi:hypothetical protein